MAKVKFNKLTRGQPLTPAAIWDNLDDAATALSGNISKDQREHGRSSFSVTIHQVRQSDAIWNDYVGSPAEDKLKRPDKFYFKLPPWQEHFNANEISDEDTPDIILESISISFDNMNQEKPLVLDSGLPSTVAADKFNRSFEVQIEAGLSAGKSIIPVSTLVHTNEVIRNRPNPALSANIGAAIGAYDLLTVTVTPPLEINYATIPALATQSVTGIDNMVIHAVFSAPITQRDNAASTVVPQNAPLHDCARSNYTNKLLRPVAGGLIFSEYSTPVGVQDAFGQLDRQVRDGLTGGLTRWSEVRPGSESLLEDQGYFCWSIPLFNVPEDEGIQKLNGAAAANNYDSTYGYLRTNYTHSASGLKSFMDAAVIPIVAPGTIHHIGVFWDKITLDSSSSTPRAHMDLGVALGCKAGAEEANYTQVSLTTNKDVTYFSSSQVNSFFSPLAYSTAAGAPSLGSGYVTQGRPFFFGNEIDKAGGVRRRNVADAVTPSNSEAAPKTNGTEQFLEVRCNINGYDGASYVDIDSLMSSGTIGNGGGIFVYIYGKMALVE